MPAIRNRSLVSGSRVSEVLADLSSQYPELKKHLFDKENRLRSFVNIYVNDEDIRYGREVDPSIAENDEISIIPSIAGGIATEDEVAKATLPDAVQRRGCALQQASDHA